VIKSCRLLLVIGLVSSSVPFAQEPGSFAQPRVIADFMPGTTGAGILPHGSPLEANGQFGHTLPHSPQPGQYGNWGGTGRPIIVLPVPMNNGGVPNNSYGSQFPGSYVPRDVPLHKYNGYVVCDPPSLAEDPAANAPAPPARRLIKITSTRSLASPGSSPPCPVYTIDGQPPGQSSHATSNPPPPRNAPPPPVLR
jgi:hypothetical protein